jgi:hypothetical protein
MPAKHKRKASPPQAGRNVRRSLDDIATDLHRLDRQNMFEIGRLLAEARDACEYGTWKEWLEDEENGFRWSYRTALNYIAAHELASKYETVSHLRVPARTIYELAERAEIDGEEVGKEIAEVKGVNDPAMPAIIAALAKAGNRKKLKYTEARLVIHFALLRHQGGEYPDATLSALDGLPEPKDAEWAQGAVDALKRERPTDDDAAKSIVDNCHRKYLERVYGGPLPEWLNLSDLENDWSEIKAEHRPEIRRRLMAAKEPLDFAQVCRLVREAIEFVNDPGAAQREADPINAEQDDEVGQDDEPEQEPAEQKAEQSKRTTKPTNAKAAARNEAARNDIGAASKAEMKRLVESNDELARKLATAEQAKQAAYRKVDELEDRLKALEGEEPKGGIDRLAAALIAALKSTKVSREKAELTIERICAELGIDPHKLNVPDSKAAAQSVEPTPTAPAPTDPLQGSASEASNPSMQTDGQWQIKPKKYVKGWSWFATNGSVSLNDNPAALFATQEEAEANARAAIARAGQLQPSGPKS